MTPVWPVRRLGGSGSERAAVGLQQPSGAVARLAEGTFQVGGTGRPGGGSFRVPAGVDTVSVSPANVCRHLRIFPECVSLGAGREPWAGHLACRRGGSPVFGIQTGTVCVFQKPVSVYDPVMPDDAEAPDLSLPVNPSLDPFEWDPTVPDPVARLCGHFGLRHTADGYLMTLDTGRLWGVVMGPPEFRLSVMTAGGSARRIFPGSTIVPVEGSSFPAVQLPDFRPVLLESVTDPEPDPVPEAPADGEWPDVVDSLRSLACGDPELGEGDHGHTVCWIVWRAIAEIERLRAGDDEGVSA